MRLKSTPFWKRLILGTCLGVLGLITSITVTQASTRIGDMELQMWYSTRNTFHTDGKDKFDWVQWRNEVFLWLVYENAVKNGRVFGQYDIPLIKNATLNARYRFRADPVWTLRESYRNQYDRHERKSYLFPENGFRDLFADLDFGEVGPGNLGMRIGYQQIVWGESDLFRSIDVINPLRIDQNQGAGEKFDEFRTPIFAFKGLYNIGNVGNWFSNVFFEPFFTPGFRGPNSNLINDGLLFRAPFHLKGCLDDNNNLIPYSPSNCSFRRADGSRVFVPWNPSWRGRAQSRHPWAFIGRTANPRAGSPDFDNSSDSPDIANMRVSYVPNVYKGLNKGPLNGMWNSHTMAGGFRIFGSSVGGFDFSLNYAFIPQGVQGTFNFSEVLNAKVYGDPDLVQSMGLGTPAGTFEEGLRRCLNERGSQGNVRNDPSQKGNGTDATILVGADLNGYNNPSRYRKNNPNGVLDDNGEPLPGKHNAVRLPRTDCFPANYHWNWTNIFGFTSTYNDFDYTGAIFRFEESFSTKEYVRHLPLGSGRNGVNPPTGDAATQLFNNSVNKDYHNYTGVWRSMVGFDLLRSIPAFKYIPGIHRSFYEQAWFLSGQWLMKNQWDNIANPLCYVVDNGGNGLTREAAAALSAQDGKRHYGNAQCRNYRWEHLFTLGLANQGLFGSRLETRNAVAFEPRAKDWLLFSQWWWRNVLGYPAVELSAGVAWYPGSSMSQGWSGLYAFHDRNQLWAEFKYYLL
jgi:hypothetical protein